jgi:hypothetical protein
MTKKEELPLLKPYVGLSTVKWKLRAHELPQYQIFRGGRRTEEELSG